MRYAATTAAALLGGFLGIAQGGYWCERLCDALGTYWAHRQAPSGGSGA
jgi:hypothetical protein